MEQLTSAFDHLNIVTDLLHSYEKKLQEKQQTIDELQSQIDTFQQYDMIDDILDSVDEKEEKYNIKQYQHREHEANESQEDEPEDKKKTSQFWDHLKKKLKDRNIEFIKELIRHKQINMDESDSNGRHLLMLAVEYGSYQLVSMCINLGADIDKEDNNKLTALKIAKKNGLPDIEEL
eukprot:252118_1